MKYSAIPEFHFCRKFNFRREKPRKDSSGFADPLNGRMFCNLST